MPLEYIGEKRECGSRTRTPPTARPVQLTLASDQADVLARTRTLSVSGHGIDIGFDPNDRCTAGTPLCTMWRPPAHFLFRQTQTNSKARKIRMVNRTT
jgi:hypothetical protein